jgi:glycosyltransferase involved in cell wall biosynthesis
MDIMICKGTCGILDNKKPRVSIGLAVYNGQRFIRETLDSLLAQTFGDFELIISDNASTDKTQQICAEYATKDKRIRYYRNEINLGADRNFNRTFELSQGKYFKWVAADDPCAPTFLEKCVEVMDNEPDVILCYPRTIVIDEQGTILQNYDNNLYLKAESPSGRFLQFMYNSGLVTPVFGLIRAEVLKKTRLLGHFLHSDIILIGELSLLGKFKEIPDYLYYKRLHPDSYMGLMFIDNKYIALKEVKKQLLFFIPTFHNSVLLPSWRLFYEHLISIKRSPISLAAKINLFSFLVGSVLLNAPHYGMEIKTAINNKLSHLSLNPN